MDEFADAGRSDRQQALEALTRTRTASGRRPAVPWAVRLAATGLWLRAALRLVVLGLAAFYVSRGIAVGERSVDFPDGALFIWLYYLVSEVDNVLGVPAGWLAAAVTGSAWTSTWLAIYSAMTVCYVVWGRLVWRGGPLVRRTYRAAVAYLMLSVCAHLLTLIAVAPGAVAAIRTGENAPVSPYTGMALVHAYEWLLLPWALALPALSVTVVVLLRTGAARAHLGLPARPATVRSPAGNDIHERSGFEKRR